MIKVGILGTGFGRNHAELYKKINGFEVVSIFGRNTEKLKNISNELSIKTTSDINEIIENKDIDLIDICLPTEIHAKWAIEGLKNNKHIFCETPLTYKTEEAEEIKNISLKYGKNVFVNMFLKYSTPHFTALKYTKEGNLGKLLNIRTYNSTSPRWGDLGLQKNIETFHIHNMDFVCEITGCPKSVLASGLENNGKSIITTTFNINDIHVVLESNSNMPNCCPFSIGFELVFTNGSIWYDAKYGEYTKEEFIIFKNNTKTEILKLDKKDEYEEVLKEILNCINNNMKSEMLDIESALNTVKLKNMIITAI